MGGVQPSIAVSLFAETRGDVDLVSGSGGRSRLVVELGALGWLGRRGRASGTALAGCHGSSSGSSRGRSRKITECIHGSSRRGSLLLRLVPGAGLTRLLRGGLFL